LARNYKSKQGLVEKKCIYVRPQATPENTAAGLNSCQTNALAEFKSGKNIFLTGRAGCGKSFLVSRFMESTNSERFPVVASTGAAAILVGGRTFHSFFDIGIMEGGLERTVNRAISNPNTVGRLQSIDGVIIDEVSMLGGAYLRAAELICRKARQNDSPWGGIQVVTIGDFSQLPPVTKAGKVKDWAFASEIWAESRMKTVALKTVMRSKDPEFLEVLNLIRCGILNDRVREFLNSKTRAQDPAFKGTLLFPKKDSVDLYNIKRVNALNGKLYEFKTIYEGANALHVEAIKKTAPIPATLYLKHGALVMLRQNDPNRRWVNGSTGTVQSISETKLGIRLFHSSQLIEVDLTYFTALNADGNSVASARNFPVNLAYATTIHKSQGMTLDSLRVDLRGVWEHGQTYVALSRLKSAKYLSIEGWSPRAIVVDPAVKRFHESEQIS
jgi:ATP-dependent DNA helicase PIF1